VISGIDGIECRSINIMFIYMLYQSFFRFRQTWIELIFKPVFNSLDSSISKSIRLSLATSCVFIFSGFIHEYIAFVSLRQITGDQMIFFLLQALSILVEQYLKQRINLSSNSFTFILTWLWIILTSKYFIRPWLIYFSTKKTWLLFNC